MLVTKRAIRVFVGLALLWFSAVPASTAQDAPPSPAAGTAAPAQPQRHFASAEEAVQALLEAARSEDDEGLNGVFGPEAEALKSGDAVADRASRQHFLEAAAEGTQIDFEGEDFALVNLGKDQWPFPIPILKEEQGWRFDTEAGLEELINRRIGRNELYTIAVVRAIVDAQHEYASKTPAGQGREFSQRVLSSAGKRDGLYWPTGADDEQSPLGPLIADAMAEGYQRNEGGGPEPYHGYLFRLLTAQGPHAPGGAMSYLVDGRLTKGFAVLAYPMDYGNSGIMTFIADERGFLFQKDLVEATAQAATAMIEYDPDPSWEPVTEE